MVIIIHYKLETVHIQGTTDKNEDRIILNPTQNIFGVLDGATALHKTLPGDFASEILSQTFNNSSKDNTLINLLKESNQQVRIQAIEKLNLDNYETLSKEHKSSTGVAIIKIKEEENEVEYIQCGDCMVIVLTKNNDIVLYGKDNIFQFDAISIKKFVQTMKDTNYQYTAKELRTFDNPFSQQLKKNRQLINTPEGYSIINGDKNAIDYIKHGTFKLDDVRAILTITDGLIHYQEEFDKEMTSDEIWTIIGETVFQHGLQFLFEHIVELEASDKELKEYIRFKVHDDKTAVHLTFLESL